MYEKSEEVSGVGEVLMSDEEEGRDEKSTRDGYLYMHILCCIHTRWVYSHHSECIDKKEDTKRKTPKNTSQQ